MYHRLGAFRHFSHTFFQKFHNIGLLVCNIKEALKCIDLLSSRLVNSSCRLSRVKIQKTAEVSYPNSECVERISADQVTILNAKTHDREYDQDNDSSIDKRHHVLRWTVTLSRHRQTILLHASTKT